MNDCKLCNGNRWVQNPITVEPRKAPCPDCNEDGLLQEVWEGAVVGTEYGLNNNEISYVVLKCYGTSPDGRSWECKVKASMEIFRLDTVVEYVPDEQLVYVQRVTRDWLCLEPIGLVLGPPPIGYSYLSRDESLCDCVEHFEGSWTEIGSDRVVPYGFENVSAAKRCQKCGGAGRVKIRQTASFPIGPKYNVLGSNQYEALEKAMKEDGGISISGSACLAKQETTEGKPPPGYEVATGPWSEELDVCNYARPVPVEIDGEHVTAVVPDEALPRLEMNHAAGIPKHDQAQVFAGRSMLGRQVESEARARIARLCEWPYCGHTQRNVSVVWIDDVAHWLCEECSK